MKKAVVFPGQGSQFKGMGRDLFARYPEAVRQADHVLGYSLAELCLEDRRAELDQTEFTQPAVYVTSALAYRRAVEDGLVPDVLAGHSVGEYAALAAADVFDFETGLTIVRERARLMGTIVGGGLAAIINQSRDAVNALIEASGIDSLELANVNSPMQVVIGGPRDKLRQFISFCCGLKIRAMPLRVSGPFHTSRMRPASEQFRRFLDGIEFRRPDRKVFANFTAEPHDIARMADVLAEHIASPVLWAESIERMLEDGVKDFVEIGERPVLTPLISDIRERYANHPHPNRPATSEAQTAGRLRGAHTATADPEGFCRSFGCKRAVVACALGNGASGPELVGALARSGTLAFLDTDGIDIDVIEMSLRALSHNPALETRFGVSIAYDPDRPGKAIDIVAMLGRYGVRHCELRGFDDPPAFIETYRRDAASSDRHPASRLIARVTTAAAVDAFLASSRSSREAPAVDALCVDLMSWRALEAPGLSLLHTALGRRDAMPDAGRVFVGASGFAGSPSAVQALWGMGADFVAAGSVLLTAREAALPDATRASLRKASYSDFCLMADWAFPELGSRSWGFAAEPGAAARMEALQSWYLAPTSSFDTLIHALGDPRDLPVGLRTIRALAADDTLPPRELRRKLRIAASVLWRSAAFLECDGTIPQWNARRNASPHADGGELAASDIMSLLHP